MRYFLSGRNTQAGAALTQTIDATPPRAYDVLASYSLKARSRRHATGHAPRFDGRASPVGSRIEVHKSAGILPPMIIFAADAFSFGGAGDAR